jgi:hypothetical protein
MPLTRLADQISAETGVAADRVAFIRHSTERIRMLAKFDATIEEYTAVQPVGSKYDFTDPDKAPVSVIVVVVEDKVHAAYRLMGVDSTGPSKEISSPKFLSFLQSSGKASRHCHKFQLTKLRSNVEGLPVVGWEGGRSRTPVQRANGSFFSEIMVDAPYTPQLPEAKSFDDEFVNKVKESLSSPAADRQRRLAQSDGVVERVTTLAYAYNRNPDVVAEVLLRANGICERCRKPAPFLRKSDQRPYLEVHHTTPLSAGGLDLVANAEATCPNCHRKAHYGDA